MKIKDLKKGDAIYCRTEKELKKVLKKLHKRGVKWPDGDTLCEDVPRLKAPVILTFYVSPKTVSYLMVEGTLVHASDLLKKKKKVKKADIYKWIKLDDMSPQPSPLYMPCIDNPPVRNEIKIGSTIVCDTKLETQQILKIIFDKNIVDFGEQYLTYEDFKKATKYIGGVVIEVDSNCLHFSNNDDCKDISIYAIYAKDILNNEKLNEK